jgi:hypothetical protein
MRKGRLSFFITCLLLLSFLPISQGATPKSGQKCSSQWKIAKSVGKSFTCVKVGKKLVWVKGVIRKANKSSAPTASPQTTPSLSPSPVSSPSLSPSPTPTMAYDPLITGFTNPCEPDPGVPAEWKEVQEWAIRYAFCARPYRRVDGPASFTSPKNEISANSSLLAIGQCKVYGPNPRGYRYPSFGPDRLPNLWNPTKSAVFQVIGIQYQDYRATTKPFDDYKKYLSFIEETLKGISDVPIIPVIRGGEKYYLADKKYSEYRIGESHNSPGKRELIEEILGKADPDIDFRGVDFVIFVSAPGISLSELGGYFGTALRILDGQKIEYSYFVGSIDLQPRTGFEWTVDPSIMIHELIYHQLSLDDHYGNDAKGEKANLVKSTEELGTGDWGHMSGAYGELLIWDKWSTNLIYDSQVRCAPRNEVTTHWLRPSSAKGKFEKALVVPLSNSKAIVVESIRSYGYWFKIPKQAHGALVYTVDLADQRHGHGFYVLRPDERKAPYATVYPVRKELGNYSPHFVYGDATLKLGESITLNGIKISVIEAGDFGDVVRVEPVK